MAVARGRWGASARSLVTLDLSARPAADYSCAIQKAILHHGRLYVGTHYLCFYSNILGMTTKVPP